MAFLYDYFFGFENRFKNSAFAVDDIGTYKEWELGVHLMKKCGGFEGEDSEKNHVDACALSWRTCSPKLQGMNNDSFPINVTNIHLSRCDSLIIWYH